MQFQQTNFRIRNLIEQILNIVMFLFGSVNVVIVLSIIFIFARETFLFFKEVSWQRFLTETTWSPAFEGNEQFGVMVLISATLLVTAIALVFAIPIGLLAAMYLSEYASPTVRRFVKPTLEVLAGIPTVIYGYFALFFLTPLLQQTILPNLEFFNGLSAGIVLGILIIPIVCTLSEDALRKVPLELREGGYGLGFTKTEVIIKVVLPSALPGIIAACTFAASRALGETMIVSIAAGQQPTLTFNPLVPNATITSFILQVSLGTLDFSSILFKSIFTLGMVLFLITLILNSVAYWLQHRMTTPVSGAVAQVSSTQEETLNSSNLPSINFAPLPKLKPIRFWLDSLFSNVSLVMGFVGLIFIVVLSGYLTKSGLPRLDWSFLTNFSSRNPEESGILGPLIGSLWLFVLTGLIVFPFGVGGAIYLEEYNSKNWFNRFLEVNIANLAAVPSILYGLLGLELFVRILKPVTGGSSIISAALTLAIMVLPTVIIASRSALRRASLSLRLGGYALGMSEYQILFGLVIPQALPGIFSGMLLALVYAMGETAALIGIGAVASIHFLPPLSWAGLQSQFTALPVQIFYWLQNPQEEVQINAAGATFVLLLLILVLNFLAVLLRDFYESRPID